ncbi:hypothetical protein ATY41_01175 [Leifsonia xyli subsp. xyli]|nr:heme-binding protein [Leifsonia xyli]ODA91325.1 hypothetical protein ATY41_01175 [Leifsonia xyli subsp. xyli]
MKIRPVVLVTAAAAGALLLAGCSAGSAPSSAPATANSAAVVAEKEVIQMPRLSDTAAQKAAAVALEQCKKDGFGFVSVSVVDRFGQLQAFVRGNGAAEHTIEASKQKAYTSAAFGADTAALVERASGTGPGFRDLPGTLFLPGGVTFKSGESSIAGIGVSGAPSGDADAVCAAAGASAIAG